MHRAGNDVADAEKKCSGLDDSGVRAGAHRQASTTLHRVLVFSLLTLAAATALAAAAGWVLAGRALRPITRITAAARAATEQNRSEWIALEGPRDELRELADTFDAMLDRLEDRVGHRGHGLGLALVSSISTAHGGSVTASANPAGGLDIRVQLPRLRPPPVRP